MQVTADLVNALQMKADNQKDPEEHNKLLAAARMLADTTKHMMEAAKVCEGTASLSV